MRRAGGGRGRERQSGEGPNGVPCGTASRLSQRPLEQMGSISYFVTPSLCSTTGARAGAHAPAIYFIAVFLRLMPEISLLGIVIRYICFHIISFFTRPRARENMEFILIWNLANDNRKEIYFYLFFQD